MIVLGNTPQPDAAFKILTPWWDVLTRYLTAGIMTIALTTTALQATKDNLVCSPAIDCSLQTKPSPTAPQKDVCNKVNFRLDNSSTTVITVMADYRQYSILDALCFQGGVSQWYPVYFPFILVAEALILLLIDNFWIMYPRTASALNHFVTLTMECYSCVGTNLDLFQSLSKPKKSTEDNQKKDELQLKDDSGEIQTGEVQVEIIDSTADETIPLTAIKPDYQEPGPSQIPPEDDQAQIPPEDDPMKFHFVLSDAMKVKTLYEKVSEFHKRYGHNHTLLINVYRFRAGFQMCLCLFILIFHFYNLSLISDVLKCKLKVVFVTDYEYFLCARFVAPYYRAVTLIFTAAALIYLLTITFAFIWSVRNSRRQDVFADVTLAGDRVHMRGDLAFLFSLLEHYNKLYCDRLAVFLSEGLRSKLDEKIAKKMRKAAAKKAKKP